MVGREQHGADVGRVLLAVAVDAAVALLDGDERPRQVEVDEVVALAVEVDALRRHVAGEQEPHGESARPNSSMTSICFTSAMPPCRTPDLVPCRGLSRPGTVAASQSRVAMRSEKTTTRVGDFGPDADLGELADEAVELRG
jgi:hypothetical protein